MSSCRSACGCSMRSGLDRSRGEGVQPWVFRCYEAMASCLDVHAAMWVHAVPMHKGHFKRQMIKAGFWQGHGSCKREGAYLMLQIAPSLSNFCMPSCQIRQIHLLKLAWHHCCAVAMQTACGRRNGFEYTVQMHMEASALHLTLGSSDAASVNGVVNEHVQPFRKARFDWATEPDCKERRVSVACGEYTASWSWRYTSQLQISMLA